MKPAMTLTQAQQRYINRVNSSHPGHARRVSRSAWAQLSKWAQARGMNAQAVCQDAKDIAKLEANADC
jgi:hypothetical protein